MSEIIRLAHIPSDIVLYVACFKEVDNAPFLKEQLLAGNQDYNFSFIDATSVISRNQVLAACFRALNDYMSDRLKSNNVHSEIVFCLSPNNNIGDAFRRFGIQDVTRDLIVIKVVTDPDFSKGNMDNYVESVVKGQVAPFDDEYLRSVSDVPKIRKTYRLTTQSQKSGGVTTPAFGASETEKSNIERQVLGLMALRGAT